MMIEGLIAAGLLPADGAAWASVGGGESGATVFHDRGAARYAKVVPAAAGQDLAAERERITWLGEAGFPAPNVLDWRVTADGSCLITSAVAGVSADRLDAVALRRAWPSIAEIVRVLHGLPVEECPFDRGLGTMMPLAREVVAAGRVQAEFLPEELQQVPPAMILDGIEDELPQRTAQERSAPVVCHGDLCLPNILVDPDTMRVSGLIDLGRLGRADPYADIALLLANARETWRDEATARQADREFAELYGIRLDAGSQRFYLHLDPLTWPG
ncbi:APH(3'') family aminoglycoside O-phosphotransferase [Nocardioides sp. NPDC101246]|uniref:APH(3'') family aminoglycoside O-phosphotransferase n=1 Tax=Nocardioides sp. NPDC101246 TaxID=3364336 RepID=UPI0037FB5093